MAPKTTKKSGPSITTSGKSKTSAKVSKVAKVSSVKKVPAKTVRAKTTSGKVSPVANSVPDKTAKVQAPKKVHSIPRQNALKKFLLAKRMTLIQQMQAQLGQSLTDEQQRRLEAAMDTGDQALVDLDREMGISLQEMRNRERQMVDEALASLEEGTYGHCAECDVEISEKRLEALPFARYCIECKSRIELLQKIEKGEQRS